MCISLMLLTGGIVFSKNSYSLKGKTIVIDVGHGGVDGGTSAQGIYEKDINLNIALKLKEKLNKHNVDVLLTRDADYDLSSPNANRRKKSDFDNRINLINNSGADLYLSIHINYLNDSRYYGAQVFYTKDNKLLASSIQEMFKSRLNSPMDEKLLSNDIYMYKHINIPGVLIECGFISNKKERELLITEDYQEKLVEAITLGLEKYFR